MALEVGTSKRGWNSGNGGHSVEAFVGRGSA